MNTCKICRPIALLLALMLLLSACGGNPEQGGTVPTTVPETSVPETTEATIPTFETVENPVSYFSLSLGEDYENVRRMDVFRNEDGSVHVEYVGDVKKVADLDANIFHGITTAFLESGLMKLDGQDVYEEGEANGSMYVEFADGGMAMVGFSGSVPEAFHEGFAAMEAFFEELMASVPVYVPQPMVVGEVEESLLNAMLEILGNSGIDTLDSFMISQVEKDDYFAFTLGLSSSEGIASGVNCAPMMMTTAFSLVIVELEAGADAEAVCRDFENTMDWRKWVCVAPSDAIIATKDNQILCIMAGGRLYEGIAAAIRQTGWTEVKNLQNPDLQ